MLATLAVAAVALAAPVPRDQTVRLRWSASPAEARSGRFLGETDIAFALNTSAAVDVWKHLGGEALAMLSEDSVAVLQRSQAEIEVVEVLMDDVGAVVASQAASRQASFSANSSARGAESGTLGPFFDDFRDLASVYEYMELLHLEHPERTRFFPNIGPSYQGTPIKAIEIGGVDGGPSVYIQATSHSREWISTSTAMAFVDELLNTEDEQLRRLVEEIRWTIVPVLNPDGYEFTFSSDPQGRMWRKTRSPNEGSECIGTDLNRNYDDHWGGEGIPTPLPDCASTDPCSNSYRGDSVWSEPEAAAVRDFLPQVAGGSLPGSLVGLLDLHSFGQMFNRPYGWVNPAELVPPNNEATALCAENMVDAIESTTGASYISQFGFELYPTCGTGMAYMYNVSFPSGTVYTVELRDTGAFGFLLPPEEIRPTATEMVAGLKVYGEHVLSQWRKRNS